MSACPSIEQLELLALGELDEDIAAEVQAHLESCTRCLRQYDECAVNHAFGAELRGALGSSSAAAETVAIPTPSVSSSTIMPTIEGYRIIREIHRGGQGVVYEALQEATRRCVALKVMLGGPFAGKASKRRFEREIELAASLRHPNIVTIHDSGIRSGSYFFAMDYVDGQPLSVYVSKHDLSLRQTLELFGKVCAAVNYAHQRGVIHRDLKPSNILVDTDGEPRVLDFGLAKQIVDSETRAARTTVSFEGHVIGTLAYMSPEQALGTPSEVDVRSDVYALGVILYEMLTGRYPYDTTGQMADVLRRIVDTPPPRLSSISRRIDSEVETIILKTLSKEKDRRYQTAGDLGRDIERYLTGDTIEAKRDSGLYVLRKTLRRYRVPVAVVAAFVVVLVLALVVSIRSQRAAVRARHDAEWQSYLANLGLADQALNRHNVVEARLRLDRVPGGFHDTWEWRHLHNRLDQSIATLTEDGGTEVQSVAFGLGGTWLASGSSDGAVRMWDVASRQQMPVPIDGHSASVQCVAINSNGTMIASGSVDQTVKLWEVATGREVRTLHGPDFGAGSVASVGSVAFSPDGERVAAGFATPNSKQGYLVLWETSTGELVFKPKVAHGWAVSGITFSPDGKQIITGGEDGLVKFWDTTTGNELGEPLSCGTAQEGVLTVAISLDGTRIAAGAKLGVLKLWDAGSHEAIHGFAGYTQDVHSVAFSPDGTILASASWDKTIRLWNTATGEEMACLTGHTGRVSSVTFSPNGRLAASGSSDGTIRLWDAARIGPIPTLRGHVRKYPSDIHALAFSPNGTRLAMAGRDHTVKLWDVATRAELASLPHKAQVSGVAFRPNGVQLVSGTKNGRVSIWNTVTREPVRQFDVRETDEAPLEAIALSPNGTRIVSVNGNAVKLWNLDTRKQVCAPMMGHESCVYDVAFSPDGSRIATVSADHTVRVWDARTGAGLHILKGHTQGVAGVTFSPDGELIASASNDHTIKLWNVSGGAEVRTLKGHSAVVRCVAFSPDGTRLASGCQDHTIKLWNVSTGGELITLRDHTDAIIALAFSPDGEVLASGSSDATVKLWQAHAPGYSPHFSEK